MEWANISAAFMLGLLSSGHCVGMCGGIMGALTMAIPADAKARRWALLLAYNLGRILTYALIGLLVGYLASWFASWGSSVWLRWLAGLLLIAMGLYLANWWRGLTRLEAAGRYLWAYLQPLGKALLPVNSAGKALLLGGIWGWLPCGLVYTALAYAMTQADALESAAIMLAFGLGTLPAVLATGIAAQTIAKALRITAIRLFFALMIIAFGLWTIWGGGFGGHHHHHSAAMPMQPGDTMSHEGMSHDHVMPMPGSMNGHDMNGHDVNGRDMNHMDHQHHHQASEPSASPQASSTGDQSAETSVAHRSSPSL